MRTFRCSIELSNLEDRDRAESVEALVGTGCTFAHFPTALLSRLGITGNRIVKLERPDGTVAEMWMGQASVSVEDREAPTNVIFDADDAPARLGRITLSGLCMKIDPDEDRLVKYLPRMKPPGWYEHQRKLKEAIERMERTEERREGSISGAGE